MKGSEGPGAQYPSDPALQLFPGTTCTTDCRSGSFPIEHLHITARYVSLITPYFLHRKDRIVQQFGLGSFPT